MKHPLSGVLAKALQRQNDSDRLHHLSTQRGGSILTHKALEVTSKYGVHLSFKGNPSGASYVIISVIDLVDLH